MSFFQMIWKYYYSDKSSREHGTLYQLRNVLNRSNVVKDPMKNFNACDDFFVLAVESHIIAAALNIFGMTSMEDLPLHQIVPNAEMLWMEDVDHRKQALQRMSMLLVDSLQLNFNNFEQQRKKDQDKVQLYANKLLSLGCFYLEYSDAIREGDGL